MSSRTQRIRAQRQREWLENSRDLGTSAFPVPDPSGCTTRAAVGEKAAHRFDGDTFQPGLDGPRLASQLTLVHGLLLDGNWHSLREIAERVGGSEAGVSARLRDLRKVRHGGWTVESRRVKDGLWLYRLLYAERPVRAIETVHNELLSSSSKGE